VPAAPRTDTRAQAGYAALLCKGKEPEVEAAKAELSADSPAMTVFAVRSQGVLTALPQMIPDADERPTVKAIVIEWFRRIGCVPEILYQI
jgi:hypothetical protein